MPHERKVMPDVKYSVKQTLNYI